MGKPEARKRQEWIGVDFDKTLAEHEYDMGHSPDTIKDQKPIDRMVKRVKQWLEEGETVKIFTARVGTEFGHMANLNRMEIRLWCQKYIGQTLEVVAEKSSLMKELWDDKARRVEENTGRHLD